MFYKTTSVATTLLGQRVVEAQLDTIYSGVLWLRIDASKLTEEERSALFNKSEDDEACKAAVAVVKELTGLDIDDVQGEGDDCYVGENGEMQFEFTVADDAVDGWVRAHGEIDPDGEDEDE